MAPEDKGGGYLALSPKLPHCRRVMLDGRRETFTFTLAALLPFRFLRFCHLGITPFRLNQPEFPLYRAYGT